MNKPSYILEFDQQSAERAGGSSFDGGAHIGLIVEAKFKTANSGASGIELTIESESGNKFNYLTMYYKKKDGTQIKSGANCINALMYFTGIKGITAKQEGNVYICPELIGKRVGVFLQKRLYSKHDMSDGFDFSIRAPFSPDTMQTVRESIKGSEANTISSWIDSYKDIDERGKSTANQPPLNGYPSDFDGDIGF